MPEPQLSIDVADQKSRTGQWRNTATVNVEGSLSLSLEALAGAAAEAGNLLGARLQEMTEFAEGGAAGTDEALFLPERAKLKRQTPSRLDTAGSQSTQPAGQCCRLGIAIEGRSPAPGAGDA